MNLYMAVVFPAVLGCLTLFFLVIGLRGIIIRKPFLISARWLLAFITLAFLPIIAQPLFSPLRDLRELGIGSPGLDFAMWLPVLMWAVFYIVMWIVVRGYLAFAVTDSSFREALLATLKKLNLPYEETLSGIHLPSVGADLQVAVQSWTGTGQIKAKQRQARKMLADIVKGMNEYYRAESVSINLFPCIIYVVFGALMALMGLSLTFLH